MINQPTMPSADGGPPQRPNRRVQRLSVARLLRQKLVLPGGVTLSTERHKGRLVIRVELPESKR